MVEIDGSIYHTATSAANYLQISRFMFYSNIRSSIQAYQFAARRRLLYKQTDLEQFRKAEIVTHVA